jgi:hypothetical protein
VKLTSDRTSTIERAPVVTMDADRENRLARIERLIAEFRAARQRALLRRATRLRCQAEALARRRPSRPSLPRVH